MSEIIRILGRECRHVPTASGAIEVVALDEGELSEMQWEEYCKRVRAGGELTDLIKVGSLAELRRTIAIPGVIIRVIKHWQSHLLNTTRTPCKVQTNGYFYMGMDRNGKECRMWCGLPKASELRFNADGSVTLYPGTSKSWTLAFEPSQVK